ncbi:MAG TPA: ATP-binding protein [Kofleriaceae bacterium]
MSATVATLHPLLQRLLRKVGAAEETAPDDDTWRELLALVARTYHDADQDRYTLERSIDISSREMQGLYQDLKSRSESELAVERQRVEQSLAILRATLEATNEGILVVGKDRRVLATNKRFAEMTETPDEVMATGDHLRILEHGAHDMADPETWRTRVEEYHASTEVTNDEIQFRDGRTLARYSAPFALADGERVGRVTFFRDITDERAAHAQLDAARAAAEAASHAKSLFLANTSHELRTPLNAVIGLADLLLLEGADPVTQRQREYLEGIAESGRHLLAMVNDVLDLAKIEAGKQRLELEAVAMRDAIEDAVRMLQGFAQGRGVELAAEVDVDTPHVVADPLRLRQILYNLISNAVKFTDRDGHVRVSATTDSRGVAIRVADTGIGIAAEHVARLFRPFEQLELPSGDRPPGTGLGLALTKRLVDMHGGTIDVASKRGIGTTFTVRLPVARGA